MNGLAQVPNIKSRVRNESRDGTVECFVLLEYTVEYLSFGSLNA